MGNKKNKKNSLLSIICIMTITVITACFALLAVIFVQAVEYINARNTAAPAGTEASDPPYALYAEHVPGSYAEYRYAAEGGHADKTGSPGADFQGRVWLVIGDSLSLPGETTDITYVDYIAGL